MTKDVVHISCKTVIFLNCLAKCKTKRVEDILNKKIKMIIGLLICSSLVGGCSANHKTNSNESSVKTVQVNKKVKQKDTIQKNGNNIAPHKVEAVSNNVSHKMNLAQIRKGNYSSIAGVWKQVGYANNRYDGKGPTWRKLNKKDIENLKISKNKMFMGQNELIRGKTLTIDKSIKKSKRKLKFEVPSKANREAKGALSAYAGDLMWWGFYFYPRNLSIKNDAANGRIPNTVDTRKERIMIYYRNLGQSFIFQRDN